MRTVRAPPLGGSPAWPSNLLHLNLGPTPMSLHPDERIRDRLRSVPDPLGFLTNVFAHAPVGFAVWNANGQVLVTNKAFLDIFVAKPPPEYNLLEDDLLVANGMRTLFQRALAGETVEVPTFWYDPAESKAINVTEGAPLAISMMLFPLFEENGEVHYVAATCKDETRMLLAAARLRFSEERLRLAQQAANIGTFELNLQTGVNTWTPELEALYGLEPGAFRNTQQDWEELVYPEDRSAATARVNEALETFLPVEGEWRVRWPDGSLHWLVGRFQALKDEAGRPHRLIGVNMEVTERKKEEAVRRQAEAAARESEESLRITLNSIGDAVIATDTEGRVTRMNPVAEQLTGWRLHEASGRQLTEVFHIRNEENREAIENPVERVLRQGVVVGLANHTVLISRDGTERAIADSGAPIRDPNGRLLGVVLVFRDQTDDRRAERALHSSDARKGAILEAALDCIVSMDHTGAISEFNPAAERTFGYARADVMGKPLGELLIPPSLRERHYKAVERYLATGVRSILGKRVELMAMRADGSEFPAELAVVRTRSEAPPTFTAYVRDLSEQKKARDALRISEARFRHLSDSGIIGILVGDTQGNIHEANDAFLRMVGFSREEFASGRMRWADLTPPEWRPFDDAAAEVLKETGAKAWEKEYVRKDGSRIPVLVVVAILEGSVGIAFVLDLTEQKRAEEDRARAAAVAAKESAHRERAEQALRNTEEQLRQSQKMEAIGTLAGSVAHDFNNLLSVVLSYAELMLNGLQPADPMRADVEQIAEAGRRAHDLTRQLLAFGRRQVLQPKVVNLNDSIAGMATMLRRLIGEDVELAVRPEPSLGTVFVDPGQIEQVLLNLILNARDAMPQGGRLTIGTANIDADESYADDHLEVEPGRYVMLSVSDTGTGMDRATQARIFEPFFTTKDKKGTGLGLSTVFGIVRQSHGHIWVYSELGRGSVFKIYLPRSDAPAQSSERAPSPRAALRGSETVLLVEDDVQVRGLAITILRRHGYHVLEAATGGDALLICEQYQGAVHLLLTDVVMPRMSGRQLWERLGPLRPEMKVLFMSGYTDDGIVHHGVLTSEFAFVQKPLMPSSLLMTVRSVLDGSGRRG